MNDKVILFGGTFDPIHNGHIRVADAAAKETGARRVIFIPAKRSPHKENFPIANQQQRLDMISLAIEGYGEFEVSDCELKREGVSYTIDTVLHFKKIYGAGTKLFWLVGADTISDLCRWHRINELIDNCCLSFMPRGDKKSIDFSGIDGNIGAERRGKLQGHVLNTPIIEVSSTEIRQRIADSDDLSMMLDPKVADYIEKNGLYR